MDNKYCQLSLPLKWQAHFISFYEEDYEIIKVKITGLLVILSNKNYVPWKKKQPIQLAIQFYTLLFKTIL